MIFIGPARRLLSAKSGQMDLIFYKLAQLFLVHWGCKKVCRISLRNFW